MVRVVVGILALLAGALIVYSGPSDDTVLVVGIVLAVSGALALISAVLSLGRGTHRK